MKLLTIILLLAGLGASGQVMERERDTVKVMLLVCDTVGQRITTFSFPNDSLNRYTRNYPSHGVFWIYAMSVRTKHNTCEGMIDPGFYGPNYCKDYWVHAHYLNDKGEPFLPLNIVVWQSIVVK